MKKLILFIALGMLAVASHTAFADPGGGPSVTVVNPPTNPAKTSSVDEPGRTPYEFFARPVCTSNDCAAASPPIATGKRLVIQHISLQGAASNTSASVEVTLLANNVGILSSFSTPVIFKIPSNSFVRFAADRAVQGYVDAGDTVAVGLETDGNFGNNQAFITVTGYLIDCNVNQCAPIAP